MGLNRTDRSTSVVDTSDRTATGKRFRVASAPTCASTLFPPSACTIHLPGDPTPAVWPNSNPAGGCPTLSLEKSAFLVAAANVTAELMSRTIVVDERGIAS